MSGGTPLLRSEVEDFLFHEAALLDQHRYDTWLSLWKEDARYWAPVRAEVYEGQGISQDPVAITHFDDNYFTLSIRVRRLMGDHVHCNSPQARMRRLIGNVRIIEQTGDEAVVTSNFLCFKSRLNETTLLAGQRDDRIVRAGSVLQIAERRILFDNSPLPSLSVLY